MTMTIDTEYDSEFLEPSDPGEVENAGEEVEQEVEQAMWKPPSAKSSFSMCLEEKDFYEQQVMEKRKVEIKVKDALRNRKTLKYDGSRIQPVPPMSQNTRIGSFTGQRMLLQSAENGQGKKKKGSKSTNWKTFSLGMGGLQNV